MPLGLPGAEVLIRAPLRFAEAVGTMNRPLQAFRPLSRCPDYFVKARFK